MPELPEVETIRRTLKEKIMGREICQVEIFLPSLVNPDEPRGFIEGIVGSCIHDLGRRGKYLLVKLDNKKVVVINFRMTGRLVFVTDGTDSTSYSKHTHLVISFKDGSQLHYMDIRKFGTIRLVGEEDLETCYDLKNLGMEPLNPDFTEDRLAELLANRRKRIKPMLMDQCFIAGIGNIYADEILFRSAISPERASNTLTAQEVKKLHASIVEVLKEAVQHRGTSIRDYVDGEGNSGDFQNILKVYGREGKACSYCSTEIVKMKLGGRSTYFCSCCQK
ncbi:MAG: bifunctional DNA-formamidopyrimidine glycosylase/DNA-(apurinic or apyrimidinic site) lyase [Clostridia bacterium]|nr:bifunctional DNA-formamidopyrimidine glycosylase/DNA-(apurinic or apyrimidinic site) lyase [Clostridia bacterium]